MRRKQPVHLKSDRKFSVFEQLPKHWEVTEEDMSLRVLVDSIRVRTPYCHFVLAALKQWFLAALSGSRVTALIIGESGAGKTKILEMFAALFPARRNKDGIWQSVIIVNVPGEPTPIALLEAILVALHDPRPSSGTRTSKMRRVIAAIFNQGVRMIILDDLQRFVDRNSELVLYSASECLKEILSCTQVSIVGCGLPESKLVIAANEQLKRHFVAPVEIPRFDWLTAPSRNAFVPLLKAFQTHLQMFEMPNISGLEMSLRMFLGTGGLIDFLAKILKQVVWDALDRKSRKITMSDFELAWSRALWDAENLGENPFSDKFNVRVDIKGKIAAARKINQHIARPVAKRQRKSLLKVIGL